MFITVHAFVGLDARQKPANNGGLRSEAELCICWKTFLSTCWNQAGSKAVTTKLVVFSQEKFGEKIYSLTFWVHGIFVQCPIYLLVAEFEQICWNFSSIVKKNKLDHVVFSLKNLEKTFIRCPSKFMECLYNVPFTFLLPNLSNWLKISRIK